jgi:hypothetical protein
MKTHDELMAMQEPERMEYLQSQTQEILESAPQGQARRRLEGLVWYIDVLRSTKYKGNPIGLCVELSKQMMYNLSKLQQTIQNGGDNND